MSFYKFLLILPSFQVDTKNTHNTCPWGCDVKGENIPHRIALGVTKEIKSPARIFIKKNQI